MTNKETTIRVIAAALDDHPPVVRGEILAEAVAQWIASMPRRDGVELTDEFVRLVAGAFMRTA